MDNVWCVPVIFFCLFSDVRIYRKALDAYTVRQEAHKNGREEQASGRGGKDVAYLARLASNRKYDLPSVAADVSSIRDVFRKSY